jgi:small multidrug resistance pump
MIARGITKQSKRRTGSKISVMKIYLILLFAIISEVIATTSLKFSEGFTKLIPSIVVTIGYGLSFYLLSIALRSMPIGVAYAIWSGVGLVLTVTVGIVVWHETLDWARAIGILLILIGIFLINAVSKVPTH